MAKFLVMTKKLLALIAGFFTHGISGSIFFYQTFSFYRHSYIASYHNRKIAYRKFFYLLPVCVVVLTAGRFLGVFLHKKLGPRLTVLIGDVTVIFAIIIMWVVKSVWILDYLFMSIYALGAGIIYLPPIINIMSFEEIHKERISIPVAIVLSGGILSSLCCLSTKMIINPKDYPATEILSNSDSDIIYNRNILRGHDKFLILYSIMIILFSIVSVLLMFTPGTEVPEPKEISEEDEESVKQINSVKPIITDDKPKKKHLTLDEKFEKLADSDKNNLSKREGSLFQAMTHPKVFTYILITLCISCHPMNCLLTHTFFGKLKGVELQNEYLMYAGFVFFLVYGLCCIMWGVFYTMLKIRGLFMMICLTQFLLGIFYYFASKREFSFIIVMALSGMTFAGVNTIMLVFIRKVSGFTNFPYIYSYISIGKAAAAIAITIVFYLCLNNHQKKGEARKTDIVLLFYYLIGGAINLVGFVFALIVGDAKLTYVYA